MAGLFPPGLFPAQLFPPGLFPGTAEYSIPVAAFLAMAQPFDTEAQARLLNWKPHIATPPSPTHVSVKYPAYKS